MLRFVHVVKIQVSGYVVTRSITKIFPFEVNEGNQNIMSTRHEKGEWTEEVFVIDILLEEKYIYGGEWNKTPSGRNLFVQNSNLFCLLEWN